MEDGNAPEPIIGLYTKASMAPMNASNEPIPKPQIDGNATIERTKIITPHIVWPCGLLYSIIEPRRTTKPKTTPTITKTAPIPTKKIENPIVTAIPPRSMKIPPIKDRTNAAVGLSPKSLLARNNFVQQITELLLLWYNDHKNSESLLG